MSCGLPRPIIWFAFLLMSCLSASAASAQSFAGGDGSESAPYQITTWTHLDEVRNHLSAHFVLSNSLGVNTAGYTSHIKDGATLANGGKGWAPIPTFSGSFDGQGYTISGIEIEQGAGELGLFKRNTGTIKNVTIDESAIRQLENAGSGVDRSGVGVLVGINGGTITQVSVDANIDVNQFSGEVGVLAGLNEEGAIIKHSFSDGKINVDQNSLS